MSLSVHRPVSRRTFLSVLGSTALAAGLAGCRPTLGRSPRAFRFIVVNDLHHASPACDPFFAALVAQMRTHAPEFCLIVGDLSDKGQPASLRAVRDAFAALEAPCHVVPGNHDCDQEENTRLFSTIFPGQLNHHFATSGWQFIGLDSTHGNKWGDSQIQPASLAWLDATLPGLDAAQPTVIFTHFPLTAAAHPRLTPTNAAEVIDRFDRWNLRCAFSGHYHARTEFPRGPGVDAGVLLTNACCARVRDNHDGSIPEGYLVCTAQPDGDLTREFVRFAPAEQSLATSALLQ